MGGGGWGVGFVVGGGVTAPCGVSWCVCVCGEGWWRSVCVPFLPSYYLLIPPYLPRHHPAGPQEEGGADAEGLAAGEGGEGVGRAVPGGGVVAQEPDGVWGWGCDVLVGPIIKASAPSSSMRWSFLTPLPPPKNTASFLSIHHHHHHHHHHPACIIRT